MKQQDSSAQNNGGAHKPDIDVFAHNMARLVEESGKAAAAYLRPREEGRVTSEASDEIVDVVKTLGQVAEHWLSDPIRTVEAQRRLAGGFMELWAHTLKRMNGEEAPALVEPDPRDSRFRDPTWSENPMFDFIKQAYLHASRWAEDMVAESDDIDNHTRHKAEFYVKQIASALAPSNFVFTNPEVLRETLVSKGENLVRGMRMLAEDVQAGQGHLKLRQSDLSQFKVGENIAITPGRVVLRNELMELIQYAPSTPNVRKRPVLLIPPWINRYYILDLNPEKSYIKWMVDQGLTVFCVSWVNPGPELADKSFADYMHEGILASLDAILEITGEKQADAIGYCVGGTLLAIALSWLAAKGKNPVASATFLTTQVDFTHAGDLKVFVDEEQLATLEGRMDELGFLEGRSMANAFNMLRPNDLIWPYVINNYLKGKEPCPFDLLYWNADSTRMPAANHAFYLRNCYLENRLSQGTMVVDGVTIDLKRITMPAYHLATKEDHIAPARSVLLGAGMMAGPSRFVLAGSGHIAGVVNPPAREKYQHWTGKALAEDLETWLGHATEHKGSWWPDWRAWLDGLDKTQVKARKVGSKKHPPMENAPGTYVKIGE